MKKSIYNLPNNLLPPPINDLDDFFQDHIIQIYTQKLAETKKEEFDLERYGVGYHMPIGVLEF